ncbi:CotY/CotZ family spore coat protein [Falsibacillus pallidus]|uniref:Spore coat protein Z n=1 Tax=Falsibacillus pallidus TaxID=493781 RepID=A0A370GYM8_9BACI|nr:CotY/CotZ family spore coat protein [Falsibacillus pallidus]RDI47744.1 spore coat protein Z [Falsibacillus pallidus]
MGCGSHDGHKDRNCVCEVVRAIKDIQDNAVNDECLECSSNCFLEPLGDLVSPARRRRADTRVFTLTNKNGDLFKGLFREHHDDAADTRDTHHKEKACASIYFRVEDVFDNCCATLRVLKPFKGSYQVGVVDEKGRVNYEKICEVNRFEATNSCITVDLDCFCAIQCIKDEYLGICD